MSTVAMLLEFPCMSTKKSCFSIASSTGITYPVHRQKRAHNNLWVPLCKHFAALKNWSFALSSLLWAPGFQLCPPNGPHVCVFQPLTRATHTHSFLSGAGLTMLCMCAYVPKHTLWKKNNKKKPKSQLCFIYQPISSISGAGQLCLQ